jgi:hypothetical protein
VVKILRKEKEDVLVNNFPTASEETKWFYIN